MQSIPLILKELNGRHDWIRTSDLFRVNRTYNCNSLILGASAAPISTKSHPKSTFSTSASTSETQKEKVWTIGLSLIIKHLLD